MTEMILPDWLVAFSHICVLLVFTIGLLCFFLRKRYIRQLVGRHLLFLIINAPLCGWFGYFLSTGKT